MIRIAFVSGAARCEVAGEAFVLRGGEMERHPNGEPVAFGGDGDWELESDHFPRAECIESVLCFFEEDGEIGEQHGPFSGLALAAGELRCGESVIARLRGSYWESISTRHAWPCVRIVEVSRVGTDLAV